MYILDVVPIQKGIQKETLSYFSAKSVDVGAIVSVPIRKKGIPSIVVARHDVEKLKSDLRNADFQLRNVLAVHKKTLFTPEFIQMCVLLKNYYVTTTGALIASLVPKLLLDEYINFTDQKKLIRDSFSELVPERFLFQASFQERVDSYKTMVRESFSAKESLFLMCPTIAAIENIEPLVGKGINLRVFVFHSGLAKKKLRESFEAVLKESQPVLIICTSAFLCIPRGDIGTIIVENEGSPYYKQIQRPYIDERDVALTLAHTRSLKYVAGDNLLRFETLWNGKEERYGEIKPLSFHVSSSVQPEVVYLKPQQKDDVSKNLAKKKISVIKKEVFRVVDKNVETRIKTAVKAGEKILLFTNRKGLAPVTVCEDCGEVLRSPDSGRPLVLYRKKESNESKNAIYQCSVTHKLYDTINKCPSCDGWKLKLLGIGTETIVKYLESLLPKKTKIYIVDGVATKTHSKVKKIIAEFSKKEGGILVATEKIIPYLGSVSLDHVIVVSVDSLFSLSGYSMAEKIMRTLMTLLEHSRKSFLIQTRLENDSLFKEFQKANIVDFYNQNIAERKKFNYPPFGAVIDIEITTTRAQFTRKKKDLEDLFKDFDPAIVIRPGARKDHVSLHVVIKLSKNEWITKTSSKRPPEQFRRLFPILNSFSPNYRIHINPDKI